ncbi:MAG: TrmH family RNA methyltransferase [Muribaculaceae bacterium]|nr:TrmH family RNA methyltransferase [Muribaculaceae bacterium]
MKKKSMLDLHRVSVEEYASQDKLPVVVVLDDVRSEMNVGSVFRTADAFAVERICLCGITAVPPTPEIHKTALGAEDSVVWEYFSSADEAVETLIGQGYEVCAVEQVHDSMSLEKFMFSTTKKYALVFGNEVKGVRQTVVDKCQVCIEIPQYGTKHSLNVANSVAILLWEALRQLRNG